MSNLKWYQFDQNNSGGSFDVDDKVCHRLFIEAESFNDAVEKAEELGCYWNGVEDGIDCPCCGDRWNKWDESPVDIERYNTEGYKVGVFEGIYVKAETRWNENMVNTKPLKHLHGKRHIAVENTQEELDFMILKNLHNFWQKTTVGLRQMQESIIVMEM